MIQFKEALYDGWNEHPELKNLFDAVKIAVDNNDLDHAKHLMITFMENTDDIDNKMIVDYVFAMLPENRFTIETQVTL